jgi:hypothetical protein
MLISAAFVEGSLETVPFAIFATAAAVSAGLAWRMLASIAEEVEPTAERPAADRAGVAATA